MKINNVNRLRVEDFSSEDQELVSKLANTLNPFLEQIVNVFSKNIDFDNLNQEILTISVTTNTNGTPKTTTQIKTTLKNRVKGLICIRAINETSFVNNQPFITFTQKDDLLTISHLTGLPEGKTFILTVIAIG